MPKRYENLTSWQAAQQAAKDVNPFHCSGFIAVDSAFNRVGIKSPQFVAMECTLTFSNNGFGPINLNADALDEEGMLELIRHGYTGNQHSGQEPFLLTIFQPKELLLHYFPRWSTLYKKLVPRFDALCAEIDEAFSNVRSAMPTEFPGGDGQRRQQFAKLVAPYPFKPALFALDKGVVLTGKDHSHSNVINLLHIRCVGVAREMLQVTRNKLILKYLAERLLHSCKSPVE